jgi:signal transduction histidine kinase
MLAAMSLGMGLINAGLWARRRDRALPFAALMALSSGFLALTEMYLMHATDVARVAELLRFSNLAVAGVLIPMVWYIHLRLGTGRVWLAGTISVMWIFCLVVNFLSPYSLVFQDIEVLRRIPTFWGEEFTLATGPANPFKFVADAASLLIMVYVADAAVHAWRRGKRFGAVTIGGSITFFIVVAGVHTPLVDAGIAKTPPIISIAFLAIIMALSWEITRDAARSREMVRELDHTRLEMDRLLRANLLGEFASTIAHELNQPLTAVLANAQVGRRYLAADPPRMDDAREMLDLIIRDDQRAAEVIRRMHGLVARGRVEREELDLNAVVKETVEMCVREIRDRGVEVELALASGIVTVRAGRVELQQVVLNLLHNALQALNQIPSGTRYVRMATAVKPEGVRFTIEDSGQGLPKSDEPDMFSPFQGEREGGVGMGLSICRRIVEAHGGSIWAEKVARGGARFVVDLPPGNPDGVVIDD